MAVALNGRAIAADLGRLEGLGVRLTEWTPSRLPTPLTDEPRDDSVLLAEIACGTDPRAATARLDHVFPGLALEMVHDLLDPDETPGPKRSSEDGPVRGVAAGRCFVQPGGDDLAWEMVEFLGCDRWLMVCRHHAEPGLDLVSPVSRRWAKGSFTTAGDLGVLFLREVAESYAVGLAHVEAAHDRWEVEVFDSTPNEEAYNAQTPRLRTLRKEVAEFRKQVSGINVRRDDVEGAWFVGVTDAGNAASRVDEIVDHTLGELKSVNDCLRSSYDLLTSRVTTRQAAIAERTQKRLDLITAAFLVPTLVAGFFGANTFLPGGNNTHATTSFEAMVVAMVIGSILVGTLLWLLRRRAERL